MRNSPAICIIGITLFFSLPSATFGVDWVEPSDYVVAGVIGASYEKAQAPETFPVAPNSWYWGGHYKTWVDFIAGMQSRHYHWLNYAWAGDVSVNGTSYLNNLLQETMVIGPSNEPQTSVEVLVIGFWANDFIWFPSFNQEALDAVISNVKDQIEIARAAGIDRIIVLGWPEFDDFDLDYFITLFPDALPFHIDEAGYNQAKDYYYQEFAQASPDYLFVDPWCRHLQTFDGVHPAENTSRRAARQVLRALRVFDNVIGEETLTCR